MAALSPGRVSLLQGAATWGLALGAVALMPGRAWRSPEVPPFPWEALGPAALALGSLGVLALLGAWLGGPPVARSRGLALWEAPPEMVWGALVLALWPAAWGPPGLGAWVGAFLLAALPAEVRWLAQALPAEHPFPAVWGQGAVRRSRWLTIRALAPGWLAARLPLWLTATLVLERMLAVRALGGDWMARVAGRDRQGLAAWIGVYALLWALSQAGRREEA